MDLTLDLDKRVYTLGDRVSVTVTVRNPDQRPADPVVVKCDDSSRDDGLIGQLYGRGDEWLSLRVHGRLGDDTSGVSLGPYGIHSTTATGVITRRTYNIGILAIACTLSSADSGQGFLTGQLLAPVTGASHAVSGRFVVCESEDGQVTRDRGAAGVRLVLERGADNYGELPSGPWHAVTDADGWFDFPVVAAGPYLLTVQPPAGYGLIPGPGSLPDNKVGMLVAGDGVRWGSGTGGLMVTTVDEDTRCGSPW